MEYIRYTEAEELLQLYPDLVVLSTNIRNQIRLLTAERENPDAFIERLALRHAAPDEVPSYSKGTITNKTCNTAITYEEKMNHENIEALQQLITELTLLETVIEKIDTGLKILFVTQREIIELFYWKGHTWSEIASKLILTESTCKQRRKQAIERFYPLSRITLAEYEKLMKLLS